MLWLDQLSFFFNGLGQIFFGYPLGASPVQLSVDRFAGKGSPEAPRPLFVHSLRGSDLKNTSGLLLELLFPVCDQVRMNAVLGGQFARRLFALESFEGYFGLKFGTVNFTFYTHLSFPLLLLLQRFYHLNNLFNFMVQTQLSC